MRWSSKVTLLLLKSYRTNSWLVKNVKLQNFGCLKTHSRGTLWDVTKKKRRIQMNLIPGQTKESPKDC
jgi:hypothetical protein